MSWSTMEQQYSSENPGVLSRVRVFNTSVRRMLSTELALCSVHQTVPAMVIF